MKLKALLRGIDVEVKGSKEIEITGISTDSKTIAPGNLFLARKGEKVDGAQFIPQAIRAGAKAIATDLYDPTCSLTQLILPDIQQWEAKLAARFYGHPAKELFLVGTTGTKGKTTSSYMIWHMLQELGFPSGLIGTVDTYVGTERRASSLTTHFPVQNQKLLHEMVVKGCKAASLEVSSHGLEQNRVGEIDFDLALFTNLYPDHLDYHKTVDAYAAAKKKLFQQLDQSCKKNKRALVNGDSPWASYMKAGIQTPIWSFGIEKDADIRASAISFSVSGTTFSVSFGSDKQLFSLPLIGRFNVYNALGAIGVALHLGASLAQASAILARFQNVPGRLEQVKNDKGIHVFVDYAHNEESLESVLQCLREISPKRIITVFGCGGNRDPARRTGMGAVSNRLSDLSILTSDNPRSEDPQEIIRQIRASFPDSKNVIVEPDRRLAIDEAIRLANPGDLVLIAGKGHEKTQVFAHQTVPFDDVAVAKEALQKR